MGKNTGPHQKETLIAETEPENAASERVLAKAGFQRGEFVVGAFEVVDLGTGERGVRDATVWRFERVKGEGG
jgi:RimJ/RimL family protein N-acetyltransferase